MIHFSSLTVMAFILCSHGTWWPNDGTRQGISSHVVDLVLPEHCGMGTRSVNKLSFIALWCQNLRFDTSCSVVPSHINQGLCPLLGLPIITSPVHLDCCLWCGWFKAQKGWTIYCGWQMVPEAHFVTLWPFRPKGYCHCLRLSVSVSVHPSVHLSVCKLYLLPRDNSSQIWTRITKFAICILGYPRLVLIMEVILALWLRILGNSAYPRNNFYLVWAAITKFTPNTHLRIWAVVLKMGVIDLDLQCYLAISISGNCIQRRFFYHDLGRPGGLHIPTCTGNALWVHIPNLEKMLFVNFVVASACNWKRFP